MTAARANPYHLRQKWKRLRTLYVRITTMRIGNYTPDAELEVAEYFRLRKELRGY